MQPSKITAIAAVSLVLLLFSKTVAAREFVQLAGVVHVHSSYSSGRYSIEELVAKAAEKQLEILVLTDHDLVAMEYGVFPFRNLIKKHVERKSILQAGSRRYLSEIQQLNKQQQAVLIIPGAQSSPFYYWLGKPYGEGLSAYDYRKELLIIGLDAPEDYDNLPVLHGGFSTRHIKSLLPRFIIFFAAFILSVYLISQKGKLKLGGLLMALLSIALMINHHPFKSSRFDQYHGDQGIAPFQDVIDYVAERGGLTFWAHPESNYSKEGVRLGPIKMVTRSYPEALAESENYTGFAAIYGDSAVAAEAGKHWDQLLLEYCQGARRHPVWAIAGADFHEEHPGDALDTYQTIFLVQNKRPREVIQALAKGRVYAVRKAHGTRLSLDQFRIRDEDGGQTVIAGEEMTAKGEPVVEGRISASDNGRYQVTVSVIKGGHRSWSFEGETPLDFQLVDQDQWSGKNYYRLDVKSKAGGYLLSNPIFVTRLNN